MSIISRARSIIVHTQQGVPFASVGGRVENLSSQVALRHSQGEYVEVWCRNTSSATNITTTDMNLTITEVR